MLVLVLEISRISAPTLDLFAVRAEKGTSRDERPRRASSRRVAPPKRKTRVQTYAAVT